MVWRHYIAFVLSRVDGWSLECMVNKIESGIKQTIIVGLGVSLLPTMIMVFTPTNYSLWVAAQQIITDKTYHNNATGAMITLSPLSYFFLIYSISS
jgi:hypothetical protein